MIKYAHLLAIFSALFICISPARAENYSGIGLGLFQLDAGVGKKSTFGTFLQLGNDFMPYLGAEIRVGTTAKATKNNEKMQMEWLVAHYLKPKFDVSDDFVLYGLAGFAVNHTSLQVSTANKLKKTNISLSYGIGAQASIGDHFRLGAEWVRYARKTDAALRTTSFQGLSADGFVGTLQYLF